jgi:hypothetical protein
VHYQARFTRTSLLLWCRTWPASWCFRRQSTTCKHFLLVEKHVLLVGQPSLCVEQHFLRVKQTFLCVDQYFVPAHHRLARNVCSFRARLMSRRTNTRNVLDVPNFFSKSLAARTSCLGVHLNIWHETTFLSLVFFNALYYMLERRPHRKRLPYGNSMVLIWQ